MLTMMNGENQSAQKEEIMMSVSSMHVFKLGTVTLCSASYSKCIFPLLNLKHFILFVGVLPAFMNVTVCILGAHGGQRRGSDSLELELRVVVR